MEKDSILIHWMSFVPTHFDLTLMFNRSAPTALCRVKFAAATSVPSGHSMSAAASPNSASVPPSKTVRVEIKGRVQGVFFRDWTVENARELGLHGWVRNRRNGSVEAVFSGDPDDVQDMVERRCRVGPPSAVVTGIDSFPCNEDPGQGFQRKPTV